MEKKSWFLAAVAVVLAAAYVWFFTDWFQPKTIHVFHVARPRVYTRHAKPVAAGSKNTPLLIFGLGRPYRLTEIKVVRLADWQTNRFAEPFWHLVSDSNSIPVKMFLYGQRIRGMKPAVDGARPQPLEPGVTYRLLVSAGSVEGRHDFTAPPNPNGGP